MSDLHIDHKVLSDLREVMEEGYLQLVQTFLDDSERRLGQLHAAKSAEELGAAAHSFKGSSSNLGAIHVASLCMELETLASSGDLSCAPALLHSLKQHFQQACAALNATLA